MRTNASSGEEPAEPTGLAARWTAFWFAPCAPLALHRVRVLSGLLFLFWLLPLTGERAALFGPQGWVDQQGALEASKDGSVPMGWSICYLTRSSPAAFEAVWWGGLAVLVLFTLGVAPRITAVSTWVIVVSFLANPVTTVDFDWLLLIPAFYLMIGYLLLGQWNGNLTPAERLLGPPGTSVFSADRGTQPPSHAANLALRLMQVHFAIVVVTGALHKLQSADWWAGVAYWYPLHRPFDMDMAKLRQARAEVPGNLVVLNLAEYAVLGWQLAFPLFAFRPQWRWLLLGGAAIAWLGSAFLFHHSVVGPLYVVLCLSYLTPEEWRSLTERLMRFLPVRESRVVPARLKTALK